MLMKRFNLWAMILRAPADEGTGGGAAAEAPEAGSILFPTEGDQGKAAGEQENVAGEGNQGTGADDKGGAGDWKEYENDPAKSDEENAAAKAEHDKAKPADKDDPANKVPADGKYDLKMPDGVELDAELAEALGPDFKELGLTNAQAQKLVDRYIETQQKRMEGQGAAWAERIAGWVDTAKKDPEIGGDKWDASAASAQRAVKALGTPELREYLNASGGGNHPELIRFMSKVGSLIKEDDPATGGAEGKGKPADAAYTLFPTDAPKKG